MTFSTGAMLLVTGACSTNTSRLAMTRAVDVGLTFSVETVTHQPGGAEPTTVATQHYVELVVDERVNIVRELTSVGVDADGNVTRHTTWRSGWHAVRLIESSDCVQRHMSLPSDLRLEAVLENMLGPQDPAKHPHAQRLSEGVYEYPDGPSIVRLTLSDEDVQEGRVLEVFDRQRRLVSKLRDVRVAEGAVIPDELRRRPCRIIRAEEPTAS
jgi:hypothetical protein